MRRATFLDSARDDILDILTYTAEQSASITIGRNFVRQLRDRCHKLAGFKTVVGRARPELRADIRSVPHENYVIFFRYVEERFEVVAILERHRDIETDFRRREAP